MREEKGVRPFNAMSALWATLLFLVLWRIGYAYHFFGYRPFWLFIQGAGLWLGIIGSVIILASMIYSLRRWNWFHWGTTRFWLKVHVLLGLVGPVLIEIHGYGKTYGLANWAAILMWAVALSGFIGLYLRSYLADDIKFRQAKGIELQSQAETLHLQLAEHRVQMMEVQEQIAQACIRTGVSEHEKNFERGQVSRDPRTAIRLIQAYVAYLFQARQLRRRLHRSLRQERLMTRLVSQQTELLLDLETRTQTSSFMCELFALWRLIHTPLTIAFVITSLTHLWAIWKY